MQSVSTWIWTRVAVSISCDDSYYTMGTSTKDIVQQLPFFQSVANVVANVQDWEIQIIKLGYDVHFQTNTTGKNMNSFILVSNRLNSTINVLLRGWLWH